jgi:hypothetical protein
MLFGYRVLQSAQRRAIDMRPFPKTHRRAIGRIEHPLRGFNEHRIERRFRKFAEVRHISMGAASLAR